MKNLINMIQLITVYCNLLFIFTMSLDAYQSPGYVQIAHELNDEVINKFSNANNLLAIGTEAGLAREVYLLGARFQVVGPKTIEEMRTLLVDCVELYKTTINNCSEIRPHLRNNSFDEKNVSIIIQIVDKKGSPMVPPDICFASAIRGHVDFETKENIRYSPLITVQEETYEEAYNLVKKQQAEKNSKP